MTDKIAALKNIKGGQVLRYMFLPGVIPRLQEFGRTGFGWLAYLMAYLYFCVRLLPPNHPYLQPGNIGKYGLRHVIMEAANRLVFKKENLDQIGIFFLLILGFILLFMQIALVVVHMVLHPAFATSFFVTPAAGVCTDMAYQLLDSVFAIPGLYGSNQDPLGGGCAGAAAAGILPFQDALHKLIEYYNDAVLVVGVAIFLYYVVTVVAETANTGTPFGRRFAHVYAPLRLVFAIGLLLPLNYGFNSAQYISLYAAKFGSSLATNGWVNFNSALAAAGSESPLGFSDQTLIARPQIPDAAEIMQFMSIVRSCKAGYELTYVKPPYALANSTVAPDIEPYLVWGTGPTDSQQITGGGAGGAGWQQFAAPSPNYATAIDATHFNNKDIVIRFGQQDSTIYSNQRGSVYPFCGEVTVHVNDVTVVGAQEMQEQYYNMIMYLWSLGDLRNFASRSTAIYLSMDPMHQNPGGVSVMAGGVSDAAGNDKLPTEAWRQAEASDINQKVTTMIMAVRDDMVTSMTGGTGATKFGIEPALIQRGWAGAAIWYNRLAMWNGSLFGAVYSLPTASAMPSGMEASEHERRIHDQNIDALNRYMPYMSRGHPVGIDPGEEDIVRMLASIYQYWRTDDPTAAMGNRKTGSLAWDLINTVFPFDSLFQIRYNEDIHPLAQLCGLGKAIIDTSVTNLMIGLAFGAGGGLSEIMDSHIGGALNAISSLFIGLTSVTMVMGFILYYVLPFLPFMYFYFAVGGWVKTIFESMVGVPLWALAHLRIDGNGLPGDAALNGYFLIFEIFVRPILTLFGLLGGLVIFTATARALQEVFPLLTMNVGGYQNQDAYAKITAGTPDPMLEFKGNILDEFFYSVIYTILLYSMAISSFKMIDQIPNNILRWMGHGIQSFADDRHDPTQGLIEYGAFGGQRVLGGITNSLGGAAHDIGRAGGGVLKMIADRQTKVVGTK